MSADRTPRSTRSTSPSGSAEEPAPSLDETKTKREETNRERNPTAIFLVLTLIVVIGVVALAVGKGLRSEERTALQLLSLTDEKQKLPATLSNKGLPLQELHDAVKGSNLDMPRAHIALYRMGQWQGQSWGSGKGLKAAIVAAHTDALAKSKGGDCTDAILVVPTDRQRLRPDNYKRALSNVHRGTRGIFIFSKTDPQDKGRKGVSLEFSLSPTRTIATNRNMVDELERAAKKKKLSVKKWLTTSEAYSFDARQFHISLGDDGKAVETIRGNQVITIEEVTAGSTLEFQDLLSAWMFNNLHPDGRMTYMYHPSQGREAPRANNMIRQWMGTVAMGRTSNLYPERDLAERVDKNIRYNLGKFYRQNGDIGSIEYRNTAKLGAAALAMISLIESPARQSFAAEEQGLMNLTLHQWQPNGEMRTFYKPKNRNDNHNFYPGETLLSWAFLYEKNKDPDLLDKSMKSFRYYKKWHLENRNPAFIPWHTQAYYLLWKQSKNQELQDWIFEMNDWLVDTMQSNSRVGYDDTIGRFYAPTERFGRPHASSTGVYLEGLIDAFAMARALGDKHHVAKYRRAILLGLRSSMQLQFQDDIDMFYAVNRRRLQGGMRTTVYDNSIRVDNVQHVLMGVQKIIRTFEPEDYHLN